MAVALARGLRSSLGVPEVLETRLSAGICPFSRNLASSSYSHTTIVFKSSQERFSLPRPSLLATRSSSTLTTAKTSSKIHFSLQSPILSSFSSITSSSSRFDADTDSNSSSLKNVSRKTSSADPSGRRKKDKVPDDFELIASCDMTNQFVIPLANALGMVTWSLAVYKFCGEMIPAFLYRSRFESLSDVLFSSDQNLFIFVCFFLGSAFVGALRYVLSRFLLRLYMNRETEKYCAVNQGLLGPRTHYFTNKDVRMIRNTQVWQPQYVMKGRGYYVDIEEFKNLRDYNQMVRFAKKLQ